MNHSVGRADQPNREVFSKNSEVRRVTDDRELTDGTSPDKHHAVGGGKSAAKRQSVTETTASNTTQASTGAVAEKWHSLTPKRKKIIFQEEGRKCQYEDYSTGKVCGSSFNSHVDHNTPRWAGGTNEAGNLRVLCQAHNLFRNQAWKKTDSAVDSLN